MVCWTELAFCLNCCSRPSLKQVVDKRRPLNGKRIALRVRGSPNVDSVQERRERGGADRRGEEREFMS